MSKLHAQLNKIFFSDYARMSFSRKSSHITLESRILNKLKAISVFKSSCFQDFHRDVVMMYRISSMAKRKQSCDPFFFFVVVVNTVDIFLGVVYAVKLQYENRTREY